jgi:catechol 2,3-dioxygenase-like lactoylglutathione lyase family enzyme
VSTELASVTVATTDFAAGLRFYDATLGALGLGRLAEFGDEEQEDAELEVAAWGGEQPLIWLVTGPQTRGVHVALTADTRADVDRFHAAALAAGGISHAAPRRWVLYRRGRYGATVADPDGNLIEVTAPE